jgi:hypothetical protein
LLNGKFEITGRIVDDHLVEYFTPVFDWVRSCKCEHVVLDIKLDYLNSSGTFLLLELLKTMEAKETMLTIHVNWYYEEEDESHYELGEIVREKLKRTDFKYLSFV